MEKKISVSKAAVLCILTALVAFLTAWSVTRGAYETQIKGMTNAAQDNFIQKLSTIYAYYDQYFVNDIDEELVKDYAIKGLVLGMGDKYGYYYTKEEYDELLGESSGKWCGIGIIVSTRTESDNKIVVDRVVPESPAEKAGLKVGDVLTEVDGTSVLPLDLSDIANLIAGDEGTSVEISVLRDNKTLSFTVTRSLFETESVIYDFLEDEKIGFIRILTFDETTENQFANAVKSLEESGAESFIFDLRNNGGGLLSSIVGVSESILPADSLVLTSRTPNGEKKEYRVTTGGEFDYPCAVLVNSRTASAAELFTAVLRDCKNALIIGETTYGKGVMQSVVPLGDGSAFKLTTSYYDPPCGVNYDGVGIVPDVRATLQDDETIDYYSANKEETVIKTAISELKK